MPSRNEQAILVVEDDEGVAVLERRALERRGFIVTCVTSLRDALAMVQSRTFDLIVADYRLEHATGLELLAGIQSLGLNIPVILVTGFSDESTIIDAIRCGVRDFVPKSAEYLVYLPDAVERVLRADRTERELAQSEARFHLFMDNSPAAAFIKDEEGRLIYANRVAQKYVGQAEWQGKTDFELWPKETAEQLRNHDLEALGPNRATEVCESITALDGTTRHLQCYRFPMQDSAGKRFVGSMAVDITLEQRVEEEIRCRDEQLQQLQKLEAIGTLAGGVAHEFNNLLQAIQAYTRFAMDGLPDDDSRCQDLQQVLAAADRAASLTRQLLGFGRRQALAFSDVEPNQLIKDLVKLVKPLIGASISVEVCLDARVGTIHADPGQFQQVIMNLCINARDAMPGGGTLLIKSEDLWLTQRNCDLHPGIEPGRYLALTVSDTGSGMSPEVMEHIFEPFFTTKGVGKGTGLGLSMVHGVVQQHGGTVRVYSEVGVGTTFKVYLPTVDRAQDKEMTGSQPDWNGGKETILVADDEPLVHDVLVRVLGKAGYRLLTARDGQEAWDVFRAHQDEIDLLLLDVVMPYQSGRDLQRQIEKIRPGIPVIFCSGYDPETAQTRFAEESDFPFIQKPFGPDVLLQTVRQVLDQEALCLK